MDKLSGRGNPRAFFSRFSRVWTSTLCPNDQFSLFLIDNIPPLVPDRALLNKTLFVDLHESKIETWRNNPSYTHLMLPEEYVEPEMLDDTYTSFLYR